MGLKGSFLPSMKSQSRKMVGEGSGWSLQRGNEAAWDVPILFMKDMFLVK